MCFSRLQLRRWATRVLFAWLLGMGMANACQVDYLLDDAAAVATHPGTSSQVHHHDNDGGGEAKSNCLDLYALTAVAAPERFGASFHAGPAGLPVILTGWVVPAPSSSLPGWHSQPRARLGRSRIPIALLRLTL